MGKSLPSLGKRVRGGDRVGVQNDEGRSQCVEKAHLGTAARGTDRTWWVLIAVDRSLPHLTKKDLNRTLQCEMKEWVFVSRN